MSSAPVDRVRESVSLWLAVNPKTGERFLLPSDADIAARDKETLDAFDDALLTVQDEADAAQASGAPGKQTASDDTRLDIEMQRRWFVARQKAASARFRRDRDAVRHLATRHKFTLLLPLYGQFQRIQYRVRHAHTVWQLMDRRMEAGWDETLFRSLLLRAGSVEQNGQVLSEDAVGELPVVIADELGRLLVASLVTEEAELDCHAAAVWSHMNKKQMQPMPAEKVGYPAMVYLTYLSTGMWPVASNSFYELDTRLALALLALMPENERENAEPGGADISDMGGVGFPSI